jgi:membrane protease YdiL (CAAX protease family)
VKEVFFVVAVATATYSFAFRPELDGTGAFFLTFGLPHALLAAYAIMALRRDGVLAARVTPRFGDLSLGVVVGLSLLLASWAVRAVLVPSGTDRTLWLFMLYAKLGDPEALQHSVVLTVSLILITLMEEIVWRGLVLERLNDRIGTRFGWIAAAGLYTLVSLPTVYLLRVPGVGYNPLLTLAAFGCGAVWSFLTAQLGRLLPSAISHAAFSYFSAVQFRFPV